MLSLRRWRPRHLLLAWWTYWVGLSVVTLWPALIAGWRVTRPDAHGSINAGVTGGIVKASMTQSGQTMWTGSISLTALVLLLFLPPLVLWLVWLVMSSRTNNAGNLDALTRTKRSELPSSDGTPGMTEAFRQTSIRQKREEY